MSGTRLAELSPAVGAVAIIPSDSVDIAVARGIYVGGAGNIVVTLLDGTTATFIAPIVGSILDISARRVLATGTTATNLLALY